MNAQETFDYVVNHLRTQGEKAEDSEGHCQYRLVLPNKVLKCAAGCLIPDDRYRPDMEGKGAFALSVWSAIQQFIQNDEEELVSRLQAIHDRRPVSEWEHCLMVTAHEFGLTWHS